MIQKPCPVANCTVQITRDRNMCRRHWLSLPKAQRDAHWRVYHEFKDALRERSRAAKLSEAIPEVADIRARYRMAAQALRQSEASTATAAAEIETRGAA